MTNNELNLANQFVNHTDRNIFLTGKAGTGKTTFLHQIKQDSLKRMVIVAPTGVAAINAKGVTIHSFFQMPFGPILPEQEQQNIKRDFKRKFNRKKIDLIRSLDLLIIDEISMVRADLLDAIDQILRKYKDRNKVFGGTQVLMIGDLQQLAPVVKENEWHLLKKYYQTPFFFSSKSFQQAQAINIELKHIYRQEDEVFIKILNEIRDNKLSNNSAALLNQRYQAGFDPKDDEGYILLTTHNYKANKINKEKLTKLKNKSYHFKANIDGHFPDNAFPNDEKLTLKKGAQVMFIKNDSSFEKQYFNGKIGKITSISKDHITVQSPDDDFEIEVKQETWNNVSYDLNLETNAIEEKIKGSYAQIPLRLAWAITIHKSQGLTFEKAIIDAELSFAHGQTYVALSRCKNLEGLVLKSPIKSQSIINDARVSSFNESVAAHQPDEIELKKSQKQFLINLIDELIDYYPFIYPANRMMDIYYSNANSFKGNIIEPLKIMKQEAIIPLLRVKENFIKQLKIMGKNVVDPEQDEAIQDRIKKAIAYFLEQTQEKMGKPFADFNFTTENKQLDKDFSKHTQKIDELLSQKLFVLKGLANGFQIKEYLSLRAEAVLQDQPKKKKKKDLGKLLKHGNLFEALRDLRASFAFEEDIPHFQVFTQESLYELCDKLPATHQQLKKINGIGKVRLQKYGDEIIEIIQAYCLENKIEMLEDKPEKTKQKVTKGQTKQISLKMFQTGKTPEEIAAERNLTTGTIINHLSQFLTTGEIKITDLISLKKYNAIEKAIESNSFENLTELKRITKDKYTYNELRLVLKGIKK